MADKKKIIIVYSTAGLGHKKAAFALFETFTAKGEEVEFVDVLEYASKIYRYLYLQFYVFLMVRARWLWGMMYYFSNHPLVDNLTRRIRETLDSRSLRPFIDKLLKEKPDAIVATHFLLPSIARGLREHDDFHAKLYTLITDYGPHSYWLSDKVDRFFVGSDLVSRELEKRDVPAEKITATGIPTSPEFSGEFDLESIREKHGLDKNRKTIFVMSGGYGVGPIERMLLSLNSCNANIQVIVVCGHNEAVYEDMKRMHDRLYYPLVVFGFTDKVAELMAVSDLMVTKAGGISVTEALDIRLPMIFYASIPGQETWNEKFLTGCGAAEKAEKVEDIPQIADRILLSDEINAGIKANIDRVRKPDAAERIVDVVLEEIGG